MISAPTSQRHSEARLARLAGMSYLAVIAAGVSAEFVLRAPLSVPGADLTAAILASEGAFRLSLLGDAVMLAADVALALLFYMLLRGAGRDLALGVMVLRLLQAAIIAGSMVLLSMVPSLAQAGETALVTALIEAHATGYDLGLLFFGMNSLAMFVLLRRSGGVPGWIAFGIGASGFVYMTGAILRLGAPEYLATFEPAYVLPLVAETALCLWLLVRAKV